MKKFEKIVSLTFISDAFGFKLKKALAPYRDIWRHTMFFVINIAYYWCHYMSHKFVNPHLSVPDYDVVDAVGAIILAMYTSRVLIKNVK
jgi:hypothetical protein